jgi:hypothetical protein
MNASESFPHGPKGPNPQHVREGRRLMIGLLVLFFGLMLIANGAIVYFATQTAPEIDPTYDIERR